MKKFLTALVLSASLTLGACAGMDKSILEGGTSMTATVTNPVSRDTWYGIEAAYMSAVRIMVQARRNVCTTTSSTTCVPKSAVLAMQDADRKARSVLVPFRTFMRNNDQISALSALASVQQTVTEFSTIAAVWKK